MEHKLISGYIRQLGKYKYEKNIIPIIENYMGNLICSYDNKIGYLQTKKLNECSNCQKKICESHAIECNFCENYFCSENKNCLNNIEYCATCNSACCDNCYINEEINNNTHNVGNGSRSYGYL